MTDHTTVRNRLLAVVTFILVVAALRQSYEVTMPIAFMVFVIATVWPVKEWLDRFLPAALSYVGAFLLLVAIFAIFIGAIYYSIVQLIAAFSQHTGEFRALYDRYSAWASEHGLPPLGGQNGFVQISSIGQTILSSGYTALVYLGFIAVLVILGMPEVPRYRGKVRRNFDAEERREVRDTVEEIARQFRRYILVTTEMSLLTGVASGLWAFAVGLDLAFVWGVFNFLLNYVPVVGNIIGILPPTLYAVIQFHGWTMPIIIFVGYAVLQITISNFIYPMMQGQSLALSPVAIIVALAFWSWIWGIAGALLAVPFTAALAIVCSHFDSTRWVTKLISTNR